MTDFRNGVVQTLSGQWARFALQLLALAVLARLLDPSAFGIYAMTSAVAGIAIILADSGLSYAAIQARDVSRQQRTNLFWLNVGASFFAVVVLAALAPALTAFYGEPSVKLVIVGLAPAFLSAGIAVQYRVDLTRQRRFAILAAVDVASQFIALLAAIVTALIAVSFWALVVQQVAANVAACIMLIAVSPWRPGLPRRKAGTRAFVLYGAHATGGQATSFLASNVDTVALGRTGDANDVGIYSRAFQLLIVPIQQLAAPLTRIVLPGLAEASSDKDFARRLKRAEVGLAYVFLVGFSLLYVSADAVIRLVLGPGWHDAGDIIRVLVLAGVFQGLGYVYYWVFLAKARMRLAFRIGLLTRCILVALVILAAPGGPVAVAWAVSAGAALHWIVQTFVGMPSLGVTVGQVLLPVFRPAAISVTVILAVTMLQYGGRWPVSMMQQLVLAFVVALGTVAAALLVPAVRHDITFVRSGRQYAR